LRMRFVAALSHPLPTTLLFDYPTLEALTDYLARTVPSLAAPPPESERMSAPQTLAPDDDPLEELDDLSQSELEDLLAEKLRALSV